MLRGRSSVFAFSLVATGFGTWGGGLFAQQAPAVPQVQAFCSRDGRDVVCDVRPGELRQISKVTATASGKQVDSTQYTPFDRADRAADWYFLVQLTANPRDSITAIDQITKTGLTSKRRFGVGVFSESFDELSSLGATTPGTILRLQTEIDKIKSSNNAKKTDLYFSAREAAQKLSTPANDNDRKALVIFSDGSTYSQSNRDKFIKTVNDGKIFVYTVFMAGKTAPNSDKRELDSLRADINGIEINALCLDRSSTNCRNVELDTSTIRDFLFYLENGGQARFPASAFSGSSDLTLTVNFVDGSTAAVSKLIAVPEKGVTSTSSNLVEDGTKWVKDNPAIAAGAGAVVLGALLLLGTMLSQRTSKRPRGPTDDLTVVDNGNANETVVITNNVNTNPERVYGWLQFLDADARRVPLGSTNVRIGRHKDNDIILKNKTVHRQHAVLHMSPDRQFSINDLGGENGTMVNGRRSTQQDLGDGDLIELGEVRLRFFANNNQT